MPKVGPIDGRHEILPGSITFNIVKRDKGRHPALPNVDTEIPHTLGVVPETLWLVPGTGGVIGYALETAKSATSITIRANVSGVETRWNVWA